MTTSYGPAAVWTVILLAGIATYAIRLSFIHLFGRIEGVPPALERALTFVPPAVLAALVAPDFVPASATLGALADPTIGGGATAVVAAWYTEDVLWTVAAGMAGLHVARFLL
ncbi:AzlD domain-containing protein [Halorarum halophilum]|uniref:AzlD domain-containing protein n=1 Tax=Halorarum halophilum TaxID=2743090 RepID=A0A7D5GL13_9EURY|nr:AzlD domain-containing protein [Halobaculum halophilum]QLG27744.1 AzlD domain-containing protein [Halobaculum halophilum]